MTEARSQTPTTDEEVRSAETRVAEEDVLTSEMLVEEVSIDGMCGVY